MLMVVSFAVLIAAFIPFVARGGVVWSVAIGRVRLDVTHDGLMLFWGAIVKSSLSILCMVLLTATTRFDRLLKGLEMMRCPRTIVMVLAFMYRYVFLLSDELMRLLRAREARDTGGGRWHGVKSLSWIVGVLFVRAYERAERVYLAMCSRGFDGTIIPSRTLSLRRKDILVCAAVICAFGAVRCAGGVR
jgi:cobalt/nickel transport system permease protein